MKNFACFFSKLCYNKRRKFRSTKYGGLAQLVRAPASHAGGRWFESISLHHLVEPKKISTRKTQKFQRLPGFFAPIF